jgi:transposase
MPRVRKHPEELLERATRLVFESGRPIAHVGCDLGIAPETLRKYVRQVEAGEGWRQDIVSGEEREEIKALRRELAPAAPGHRDPEGRERGFRGRARSTPSDVSAFIDSHRERLGVESMCSTLGVSASAHYERANGPRSARAIEDERLLARISELRERNYYA